MHAAIQKPPSEAYEDTRVGHASVARCHSRDPEDQSRDLEAQGAKASQDSGHQDHPDPEGRDFVAAAGVRGPDRDELAASMDKRGGTQLEMDLPRVGIPLHVHHASAHSPLLLQNPGPAIRVGNGGLLRRAQW